MPRKNPVRMLKDVAVHTVKDPVGTTRHAVDRAAATAGGMVQIGRTVAGEVTKSARNRAVGTAAAVTGLVPGHKQEKSPPADRSGPLAEPARPRKSQGDPVTPAKKATAKKAPTEKTAAKKAAAKRSATKATPSADQLAAVEDNEVTTPVGTTGADVATNPDTAETDLQQPDTPPLMDPATTKSVISESETLRKAADTDKG